MVADNYNRLNESLEAQKRKIDYTNITKKVTNKKT